MRLYYVPRIFNDVIIFYILQRRFMPSLSADMNSSASAVVFSPEKLRRIVVSASAADMAKGGECTALQLLPCDEQAEPLDSICHGKKEIEHCFAFNAGDGKAQYMRQRSGIFIFTSDTEF